MACLIWVSTKIDFIFYPIGTFISTIFTPVLVAGFVLYFQFVHRNAREQAEHQTADRHPHCHGSADRHRHLLFLGLIPNLVSQIGELLTNLPSVVRSLNKLYQQVIEQE